MWAGKAAANGHRQLVEALANLYDTTHEIAEAACDHS